MQEQLKQLNNWETKKTEIIERISWLKENAPTEEEFYSLRNKIYELEDHADINKIPDPPELQELKDNFYAKTSIKLGTLAELRFALSKIDMINLTEIVAHENAHGNKAEELGQDHNGYIIAFFKDEEGNIKYLTMADLTHSDDPDVNIQIIEAPEKYGNGGALSSNDLKNIEKYKNIKNNQ